MIAVARVMTARLIQVLLVALLVTVGTNVLIRAVPGDPARTLLGDKASADSVAALRHQLGLDQSLLHQVLASVKALLHGDLGTSFAFRQNVLTIIGPSVVVTAGLALLTIVISVLVGMPLGVVLALARSGGADLGGRLLVTVLLALPSFMAGLILLYLASLELGLAPPGGWAGAWPGNFRYLWLPAVALSLYLSALIARAVRQSALDAIGQPYVEAARTRGVSRYRIVVRHVVPNAVLPVITLVGFNAGLLLSGAVTVETVFALPGLGHQLVQAMASRDLPIVQGIALLTAVSIVVFNMLADLLNIAVDPRLRSSR